LIYYGLHRLLGQEPAGQVFVIISYTLIGTTVAGTFVYIFLDQFLTERTRINRKRDMFPTRRQTRRRNPIRLSK
jgi:hypothetical protein